MEELNQIRQLCENYKHTDFRHGTLYHQSFVDVFRILLYNKVKVSLILTDPPYNVKAKAKAQAKKGTKEKKVSYDDYMPPEKYQFFIHKLLNTSMVLSDMLIVSPGHNNIDLWCKFKRPDDFLFHHKPDGQGFSKNCRCNKTELYLMYGGMANKRKLPTNTIIAKLYHHIRFGSHPHPKSPILYKKIIDPLEPSIVFDPMLGSGTTGVVCEELGIPWFGCEINQTYIDDDIIPRCNNAQVPMSTEDMREL